MSNWKPRKKIDALLPKVIFCAKVIDVFEPILKAKLFIYDAGKVQRHKKTMPKREVMVAPSSSGPHMKIEEIVSILFPLVIQGKGKKQIKQKS